MGRLQKKKPASPKKAEKNADNSAPDDVQENRDASSLKDDDSGSQEVRAKKQKSALPASRKTPGDQTFLMKLLDRYFGSWIQFLREVRNELGKVVWPSRKETTGMTLVVIVFVLIVSLFLGIMDFGLSSLVRIVL